ncbi:MAG: SDR family oxidoreductase [Planctomycetes bacterium]|nr:SDR family oxidoreductase [Planctomycetota bacterium]
MNFENKSVIVTGSATGMGSETAKRFAALGAKVVINYAKSEAEAKTTVEAIKKAGGAAILCQGDVSREEDARRIVAAAVGEFGRLDILVNNAGVTAFIPFNDLEGATPEVWQRLYSTNVLGAFLCARAAAPEMRKSGGGVIINNASVAGYRPSGSSIPYCCSKAALLHLTRCLAVTLAPEIRVCSVSPGFIDDTRWHRSRANFDQVQESGVAFSLVKRTGSSAEIAAAILYLASDEASFCTGSDLLMDGGMSFTV